MILALVALGVGVALLGVLPLVMLKSKLTWPMRALAFILLAPPAFAALGFGVLRMWMDTRVQPAAAQFTLANGVRYERRVETTPAPLVWHVAKIDMTAPGISLLVTPGDPQKLLPYAAKTTSEIAKEHFAAVAISGDLFTPKFATESLAPGAMPDDAVKPRGFAASRGMQFGKPSAVNGTNVATLYIADNNVVSFQVPAGTVYNAISGDCMLLVPAVSGGKSVDLSLCTNPTQRMARAAVGYDEAKKTLILLVVDGEQANFSQGVTAALLRDLLATEGATVGMALAPGPSATLVGRRDEGITTLSSPVPSPAGFERPVANHLLVLAQQRLTTGN